MYSSHYGAFRAGGISGRVLHADPFDDIVPVKCPGCGLDSTMGKEMSITDFQCPHCGWTAKKEAQRKVEEQRKDVNRRYIESHIQGLVLDEEDAIRKYRFFLSEAETYGVELPPELRELINHIIEQERHHHALLNKATGKK